MALIHVGGSCISAQTDPADIDLAVWSDIWNDTLFMAAFAAAHPGEDTLVDFYFTPKHSAQHMEDLFRHIRGSSRQKGTIQLLPRWCPTSKWSRTSPRGASSRESRPRRRALRRNAIQGRIQSLASRFAQELIS
jgi:hypothetical protein